ncbi:MAG TPA: RNA-binding protein [Acetobacteraceae bacterium]|nr:RNA-binding protein [Acetobacteraceae bacterium]
MAEPDAETGPLRRCVVTRERGPKERMLRFVVGPDHGVVPDLRARLPGRGMWLSARADVLETAVARGAFARAARGAVRLPPDLPELLRAGLTGRISDLLGLARRAGQAIAGFEKGREWVRSGRVALVIQAQDGSPDERDRFLSGARDLPVYRPLRAAALGAVFGLERAVHVVVAPGNLATMLVNECERLAGLMALPVEMERSGESRQAGQ